jgi:hypothetical protein
MARMSRRIRIIAVISALALLGALGLGFALLRPAEEENPWEFLGPADDDVTSLVFDPTTPTTLYAATQFGGVYKSEDGGTTWRYLRGSGFRGRSLAIASTTPTTLYVYGGRGVYKSADGGATWRAVNRGLELGERNWVSALSIDPTNPRVVFAGTDTGVYKSTDGGESWRAVNRGLELGEGIGCLRCPSTRQTPAWSSPEPALACTRAQTAGKPGARSAGGRMHCPSTRRTPR